MCELGLAETGRRRARSAHRDAFFVGCDDHVPQPWDQVGVLLVPVGREALPHGLVTAREARQSSPLQSSPPVTYSRTLMTLLDATKRASWVSFARRPSGAAVVAAAGGAAAASGRDGAMGASAIAVSRIERLACRSPNNAVRAERCGVGSDSAHLRRGSSCHRPRTTLSQDTHSEGRSRSARRARCATESRTHEQRFSPTFELTRPAPSARVSVSRSLSRPAFGPNLSAESLANSRTFFVRIRAESIWSLRTAS